MRRLEHLLRFARDEADSVEAHAVVEERPHEADLDQVEEREDESATGITNFVLDDRLRTSRLTGPCLERVADEPSSKSLRVELSKPRSFAGRIDPGPEAPLRAGGGRGVIHMIKVAP